MLSWKTSKEERGEIVYQFLPGKTSFQEEEEKRKSKQVKLPIMIPITSVDKTSKLQVRTKSSFRKDTLQ